MPDKKISELPDASLPIASGVKFEAVQGGVNVKVDADDMPGSGGTGTVESVTGDGVDNTDPDNPIINGATEGAEGTAELATQNETDAGTDDLRIVTPLKLKVKNRGETAETADRALAQTDDQKVLFANKATTLTFNCPSLEENTYIIIVQVNAGDVAFTTSGGVTFENSVTPGITGGAIGSGIALWYRTATSVLAMVGDITNLLTSLSINGTLAVKAGSSSGIIAKVGGVINTDSTTVGNVGTGEDTLYTYSVLAATLSVNKDSIKGFVAGSFAANANNKNIRVKYGGTTIFATGAVAFNAGSWRIDFFIVRTGATTQKCIAAFTSSNTTLDETCTYSTAGETLSGAVTLTVTGEATSNNDIVGEIFRLEFMPHE
jgi:hypothetical protein